MLFGLLNCHPFSVPEIVENAQFDREHVAAHGILYYGEGCEENKPLLIAKDGPFDGIGPIPIPAALDYRKCILIAESDFLGRLGKSGACGMYHWKCDAIVIGEIVRCPESGYPIQIDNVWMVLMQQWLDLGTKGPYRELRVVLFTQHLPSELPWSGAVPPGSGYPVVNLYPVPVAAEEIANLSETSVSAVDVKNSIRKG